MITRESVLKALSHVDDPDLKKDLVTLGMIEDLVIGDDISFTLVLTTPACPMKDMMVNACKTAIRMMVDPNIEVKVTTTSRVKGSIPLSETLPGVKHVIAVASGKAEYGPRALGNRSILADPRDPSIKDKVNKIKQRELFRPFAPVIMEEYASEWFDMDYSSPYMQFAPRCLKPDLIPSVCHVD